MYNIGDKLFYTTFESVEKYIPCPACNGSKYLRIMFHDDSIDYVDCPECGRGYNPPTGYQTVYERTPLIIKDVVNGIRFEKNTYEYNFENSYYRPEHEVFDNEKDAKIFAQDLIKKLEQEELNKILNKQYDKKSWAQNANYHRREIKRCQKDLEYHTRKLDVAKLKVKTDV